MDHDYWQSTSEENDFQIPKNVPALGANSNVSNKIRAALPDGLNIEIRIHNMTCDYALPLHIDLRQVASNSINVDYDRAHGVLRKQLRNPLCQVKIYNSGKVVITGCKSEEDCKRAARAIGRMIQRNMNKLDQRIRIRNYRVSNILASCRMPFDVRIEEFARKYRQAYYEPELMVGLEWNFEEPKANLRIHTTGSIMIAGATSEANLVTAIQLIYPYVKEFEKQRAVAGIDEEAEDNMAELQMLRQNNATAAQRGRRRPRQQQQPKKERPTNGFKQQPAKRVRYERGQIQTGFYNNAVYHSDEEGDADYEEMSGGSSGDEDGK